jgi:ribosomal-protein-alanine N-acetyltransferase
LLAFELENRAFFESHINARPAGYYRRPAFRPRSTRPCVKRRRQGLQYLLRDAVGQLVGRVNLTRVRRAHFHSAELGYRVAQSAGSQGYASEAVRRVVAMAFGELKLQRIEATARPENLGSQRVLARNGFTPFGRSTRSFELSGAWYDLNHYELRSPA